MSRTKIKEAKKRPPTQCPPKDTPKQLKHLFAEAVRLTKQSVIYKHYRKQSSQVSTTAGAVVKPRVYRNIKKNFSR